ncbi:hypothetical protein ACMXYX_09560 [Neptuniibacter sp. QD72_48]|uniref:hypothetical protein n=1 Tax=unclassified Neptuniibacter TaxID=2630693 RepID=UPI0039F51AF4
MLKLVKDFIDYQFTYFWVESSGTKARRISKKLPTLEHAREWFIDYHYAQYNGIERRKSKQDQRKNSNNRFNPILCKRNASNRGRRITDKPIQIDIDLSKKKIKSLQETACSE